jgi:hypothetical protein
MDSFSYQSLISPSAFIRLCRNCMHQTAYVAHTNPFCTSFLHSLGINRRDSDMNRFPELYKSIFTPFLRNCELLPSKYRGARPKINHFDLARYGNHYVLELYIPVAYKVL